MELNGTHKFAAPPQAVWDALHNSSLLQNATGAEQVTWDGENAITVRIAGLGPLKGPYQATVPVPESNAPNHMKAELVRNSVSGTLTVDLAPDGAGTLLTYHANGKLSGAFAMLDNPLTRPVVDGQINSFFSKLDSQL